MYNLGFTVQFGSMPEWLMGADCKSAGYTYAGSNPARPKKITEKMQKLSSCELY